MCIRDSACSARRPDPQWGHSEKAACGLAQAGPELSVDGDSSGNMTPLCPSVDSDAMTSIQERPNRGSDPKDCWRFRTEMTEPVVGATEHLVVNRTFADVASHELRAFTRHDTIHYARVAAALLAAPAR